jgi:hypothetical protein
MKPGPEKVKLKIGALPVVLPIHVDMDTTLEIAGEVEERLKRIEDESDTVDTQRFAVQAAYEYAAELRDLKIEHKEDTDELTKTLDKIVTLLKQLTKRFHLAALPEEKDNE